MFSRSWSRPFSESGGVGRPAFVTEFGLWTDEQAAAAEQIEASLDEVDLVRLVFGDPHGLARSKTLTADAFRSVLRNGMDFSSGPFIFDTGHAAALDYLSDPGVGVDEIMRRGQLRPGAGPADLPAAAARGSAHRLGARRRVPARRLPAPALRAQRAASGRRPIRGPRPDAGARPGGRVVPDQAAARSPRKRGQRLRPPGRGAPGRGGELGLPVQPGLQLRLGRPLHQPARPQAARTRPAAAVDRARVGPGPDRDDLQPDARAGHRRRDAAVPHPGQADRDAAGLPRHLHVAAARRQLRPERLAPAPVGDGRDRPQYLRGPGGRHLGPGQGVHRRLAGPGPRSVSALRADGQRLPPPQLGVLALTDPDRLELRGPQRDAPGGRRRLRDPCREPHRRAHRQPVPRPGGPALRGLRRAHRHRGRGPAPGRSGEGAYETLPQNLGEALEAFRAGQGAELLGKPLAATLAKLKESEFSRFEAWRAQERPAEGQVTEWEQREYFEAY